MRKENGGVLVVEDEADLRQGLALLIEHEGYRVETAANGKEALAKIDATGAPCLIILDLMMPEMDGWKLREALLDRPELARVPVVLLSGDQDLDKAAHALKAADFLRKPVDFSRLFDLVKAYC